MKNKARVSEIMKSALDVWTFLKSEGGLDTLRYDSSIEAELRSRLSLPSTGDFDDLLKNAGVTTEALVVAFFETVHPFAEMMSDLLRMFEKAGAQQANTNLAIRFDFGAPQHGLRFDLSHFRAWTETWVRASGLYLANIWNSDSLWLLHQALGQRAESPENPQLKMWLDEYHNRRTWPTFLPSAPISGEPALDTRLARVWRVWTRVVKESARHGRTRDSLRERAYQRHADEPAERDANDERGEPWCARLLGSLDSENWAGSVAGRAYNCALHVAGLPQELRAREAEATTARLDEVFGSVPTEQVEGDVLIRELEEFLKLPIWRRRHELYSVWISTQLLDALEDRSPRIHQVNGDLFFSFSGTHLATADAVDPRLQLWAELRSPLSSPVGKSRRRAIQPDYTLAADPVTNPEASILVVECKQYQRPSAQNFSAAMTDYARGRPNAHIVLVNYGPADQSIMELVEASVRGRTSLVGLMRPGSQVAQGQFRQLVQDSVAGRYGPTAQTHSGQSAVAADEEGAFVLTWGSLPADLDLHLRIDVNGDSHEIDFQRNGDINKTPWASLDGDIRSGHGPETIRIARWLKAKYRVAVHKYSGDWALAGCGATLAFSWGQRKWTFRCPAFGPGDWWRVLTLDTSAGAVDVFNSLDESPW